MRTSIASVMILLLSACDDAEGCRHDLNCDLDGRCWASLDGADMDAQAITIEELHDAVSAGTLEADDAMPGCWEYADSARTCVVLHDWAMLVGRPLFELDLEEPGCDVVGPWDSTAFDDLGSCWGLFGDVAVRLR